MNKNEAIAHLLAHVKPDLAISPLNENIDQFGGHPLRVLLNGKETDFWSEFIRVKRKKDRTISFRVITRYISPSDFKHPTSQGIRPLIAQHPSRFRIVVLDSRSNVEREIEPGTLVSGATHAQSLRQSYTELLEGRIDVLLTPIREGSLGPTSEIGDVGPFAGPEKNNPEVWDIAEEIQVGKLMNLVFTSADTNKLLQFLRSEIIQKYENFAIPLVEMLNGQLQIMDLIEIPEDVADMLVDTTFFSDQEIVKSIDFGLDSKKVEQVIAYPYPTEFGVVYARLFRVWNTQETEFEVVRVLQTHPQLNSIDGLRIDSSCVDGVHNLDSHCDCKAQLEQALYDYGLKRGKNVVVIQMTDHEGKGWGSALKGAGTHRPVREYNAQYPNNPINHVPVAAQFYNALGVPADNRRYGAAQAVVQFLGISHVSQLLMDNSDKVHALEAAGITYDIKEPIYADESTLTPEANGVNFSKKNGGVIGPSGKPVLYEGK